MSHYKPYPAYKDSGVAWLGRVPEHWDIRSVKTLAHLDGGAGFPDDEQGQSDNPIPFFKVAELANGLRYTANTVTEETAKRLGAKIFPPCTLVFAKVGAALLLNRRCLLEMSACLDNNMMALLPGTYESQWLFWVFSTLDMGLIANPGAVPSINQEQVGNIRLGVPTAVEQKSIAQSLNRETTRIDALIEKKTRFIQLLREKRQALITHAVTKGLDPNVKMKDSGVEWLGDVPEHWDCCLFKHKSLKVTDGAHISPDTFNGSHYFVSTKDVVEDGIDFDRAVLTSTDSYNYLVKTGCNPLEGDVLFSKDGTIGRTVVVRSAPEFVVASSLIIIRPDSRKLFSDFFNYFCQSKVVASQVESLVRGAGLPRISIQNLVKIIGAFPPLAEQKMIAEFLNVEILRINSVARKTEHSIALLKERRAALITAAVTGQIDLREAV